MSELTPELAAEMHALVREAQTLAADVDDDVAEIVRRAAEERLPETDARKLFTRILTAIRASLEEQLDDRRRKEIAAEVEAMVTEATERRRSQTGQSDGRALAARDDAEHVVLFSYGGLDVRRVTPQPSFLGQSVPLTEGYTNTVDLNPWEKNLRLELHLHEFEAVEGRPAQPDEIVKILQGRITRKVAPNAPSRVKQDEFRIAELAQSIAVKGVERPPVIDWWGTVWDGNRRVAACLLILQSPDYDEVAKEHAARIRVWQAPKDATDDEIQAIVTSLNFEPELKVEWPEYVRARQVYEAYSELREMEIALGTLTDAADRRLRRRIGEKFGIRTDRVTRYLRMMTWAKEFEEHHREERNRDAAEINYRTNEVFQYFYELDAGQGVNKLSVRLEENPALKALIFDLLYEGKFRRFEHLRGLKSVVHSQEAVEYLQQAHAAELREQGQRFIEAALDVARKDDPTIKKIGAVQRVEEFTRWLEEDATVAMWREMDPAAVKRFHDAVRAVEGTLRGILDDNPTESQ